MKKESIVEGISMLLVLLFVYTGVTKLLTYHTFALQLTHQPLTNQYVSLLVVAVPAVELGIAACLLVPRLRKWGLYSSLALMSLFTVYVGYMLFIWPHNRLPCSCGGTIRKMSWQQHFVFNSAYTLIALTGILLNRKRYKPADEKRLTEIKMV